MCLSVRLLPIYSLSLSLSLPLSLSLSFSLSATTVPGICCSGGVKRFPLAEVTEITTGLASFPPRYPEEPESDIESKSLSLHSERYNLELEVRRRPPFPSLPPLRASSSHASPL